MYEDPWISSLVAGSAEQRSRASPVIKTSLSTAISRTATPVTLPEPAQRLQTVGPPEASVPRRASSFSDYHERSRQLHVPIKNEKATRQRLGLDDIIDSKKDSADRVFFISDESLPDPRDEPYELYREQLLLTQFHLDQLYKQSSSALDQLASLAGSFRTVDAETDAFQAQCGDLLGEQERLARSAETMSQHLRFYGELDPITRRLNAASGGANAIRADEYSDILARLDGCAEFMAAHPTHKEAAAYGAKYRQLMSRALTLMRASK